MSFILDLHNHTIASGHAYSTVQEIAQQSKEKGLKMIGITDHGPLMPGVLSSSFTGNLIILPEYIYGVEVLRGVEANILDQDGKLDVPERRLRRLDIVLAGLHDVVVEPWDIKGNTRAILNAMENDLVDIISHPGNPIFPIDKEAIVLQAKKTNTLLEVNDGSFRGQSRLGSYENCYEILRFCIKHEVPIIVGSDSHISFDVGHFDNAIKLLKDINMPEELIMNFSTEKVRDYLFKKGKSRFSKNNS